MLSLPHQPTQTPYERPDIATNRIQRLFRSCSGRPIELQNLPNAIPAFITSVSRKFFNLRPHLPFIPYSAIPKIAAVLNSSASVVEVGAGMSTLWLARHAGTVISLEWEREWYDLLSKEFKKFGITNVDLRLCQDREELTFASVVDDMTDFILIDGGPRPACLKALWPKLKHGGSAYLDNWDSDTFWLQDFDARAFLDQHSTEIAEEALFVDYVPTQVAVNEGLLLVKR